jgi:hypothetical protein
MSVPSLAFELAGFPLIAFWFFLIFIPRSKATRLLFEYKLPMLYMALLYTFVIGYGLITDPIALKVLLNPSLSGVQGLLSSEIGASAGWIHFLCFDLLIGSYIWKKSMRFDHSALVIAPILFFTLMLGPFGWLCFEILHWVKKAKKLESSAI